MKTILFLFAAALGVAEVPISAGDEFVTMRPGAESSPYVTTGSTLRSVGMPTNLSIACGGGAITINYATGKVALPEGVKLDDAALQFWKAVAEAFPEARRHIIGGGNTVNWTDAGVLVRPGFERGPTIELGRRSDGVMVWREVKK